MDSSNFQDMLDTPLPMDPGFDSSWDIGEDLLWNNLRHQNKQETTVSEEPFVQPPLEFGPELLLTKIDDHVFDHLGGCFCPLDATVPDIVTSTSSTGNSTEHVPSFPLWRWRVNNPTEGSTEGNALDEDFKSYNLWEDNPWSSVLYDVRLWCRQSVSISCYSNVAAHTCGKVFFFIDGDGEDGWNPSSLMTTTILDPNNCPVAVVISKEDFSYSRRFICTFQAQIPGCYSVSVLDSLLNLHISGSPFIIPVSRNYNIMTNRRLNLDEVKIHKAWGIAYSPFSQRVYVADRNCHHIVICHLNGTVDKCFGTQGFKPGRFFRPTGIAVDHLNQRLVITDKDNHRICFYTLDGTLISTFGSKGFNNGEMSFPWGVSVSPKDSSIAVADSNNHRIQIFDSNGQFLRKYSIYETNPFESQKTFNHPRGISFDRSGDNIYVTDFKIQSVFKLNVQLTEKVMLAPPGILFNRPQGIAIDPVGNLLVCDSRRNCIQVVNPAGEHISTITGNKIDSFWNPQDLTVTPNGEIIVVDSKSRVRVL